MTIKLHYLPEPRLQFGDYFEHEDTKIGLAEFGPFGINVAGLHPPEIRLGFVGTRQTNFEAQRWLETCRNPIESEAIKVQGKEKKETGPLLFVAENEPATQSVRYEKIVNRDFIGFDSSTRFKSSFVINSRWERVVPQRELEQTLQIEDKVERINKTVDLFLDEISSLAQTDPPPSLIIVALPNEVIASAHSVMISGSLHLNFRRALKARSMKWGVPIQLLQPRTISGKGEDTQEVATRAWNLCTALYYKAGGIPWRPLSLEEGVCFLGISFYVAKDIDDTLTIRSSVAQAFDHLGQGLVLRGEPFEWDRSKHGRFPHLPEESAFRLVQSTLKEYVRVAGRPPKRVVIHKSSEFWGPEHAPYNELAGCLRGIEDVFARCETDLVALRPGRVHLFREGQYPPPRGTYFTINETSHFIYTMGFIPYLETYPGPHVPEPWQIIEHRGSSAPIALLQELLLLTKMNVNNCSFADGTPITLLFSRRIGEILSHIDEVSMIQSSYRFYM